MITDPTANPERRRWYGLRIGDAVVIENGTIKAEVYGLDRMDNNRCYLRMADGTETPYVAEWCESPLDQHGTLHVTITDPA